MTLTRLLDILIPRFITEDAAAVFEMCEHCPAAHPQPVCSMDDVYPGEVFDGIVTVRFFNLFGVALWTRCDAVMRPWKNPHDKGAA